jgi:DNA-binding response OmpR family regulator
MNGNIVLCTDDSYLANTVSKLFGSFGRVPVFRLSNLSQHKDFLRGFNHLIIGVNVPDQEDWALCRSLINDEMPFVYLMLRKFPSPAEQRKADEIGIRDILIDPLSKIRSSAKDESELFSVLKAPSNSFHEEELVTLGKGAFFHKKEFWVGSSKQKNHLSDHESDLLLLFIENEGRIVRTEEIAAEIWSGPIEMNSVRKSIKRLREKLGPAHDLIKGRKQGGYIFKREES